MASKMSLAGTTQDRFQIGKQGPIIDSGSNVLTIDNVVNYENNVIGDDDIPNKLYVDQTVGLNAKLYRHNGTVTDSLPNAPGSVSVRFNTSIRQDSIYAWNGTTGTLTINDSGWFRFIIHVSVVNTNNQRATSIIYLLQNSVTVNGLIGWGYHRNNTHSFTTASASGLVNVTSGDDFTVEAQNYNSSGNLETANNSCSLLVEKV